MFNPAIYEHKMDQPTYRWLVNIALTLIIIVTAEIGRLIGIKSLALAISVVWPPTGFSLAALLLFGFPAWPGIFLGNFLDNFFNLYVHSSTIVGPFNTAVVIALGSLGQALLGAYIIRHLSSPGFFNTVNDIIIFLVPAGLMTCIAASSVGVMALYLLGALSQNSLSNTWITFYLGDSLGVFVFTPLLVVWMTKTIEPELRQRWWEALIIFAVFTILSFLTFVLNYPLLHLYLPLAIWPTFRLRMHGATMAILLISLVAIIPTSLGYGSLNSYLRQDQLFILVSFIEVIVFLCLILAAVLNERERAWQLLQMHNVDLRETLGQHRQLVRDMKDEIFIKEKLASLGTLTLRILRQVQLPLKRIDTLSKNCRKSLKKLRGTCETLKGTPSEASISECVPHLEKLDKSLQDIAKSEVLANRILSVLQQQAVRSAPGQSKVSDINLHTLLNRCLDQVIKEAAEEVPAFVIHPVKEYDRAVQMIPALSEDIAYAFIHFFEHARASMMAKKKQRGAIYKPTLTVRTIKHHDKVYVVIRDNGAGISPQGVEEFFKSFVDDSLPLDEEADLELALARDNIVQVHHGEIKVDSNEGEFLEFTIMFPCPPKERLDY